MQTTNNVSEPVFANSKGWFRYNYDQSCLEFLEHETKLVVCTWVIPVNQWNELPSQREYCENIIREANRQVQSEMVANQREKARVLLMCKISAVVAVICGCIDAYLFLSDTVADYRLEGFVSVIGVIAFAIASSSYWKFKEH